MNAVGSMAMATLLLAAQAEATALSAESGASAPSYGPATPAPVKKPVSAAADDGCAVPQASTDQRQIVICAQRPQGYRLNPDVMEARRAIRSGGPPKPPEYRTKDNSCATVGPMGCFNAGINLVGAALTAVAMAEKAVKGENVGKMFITDPHPNEYQLYLMAKARREAREAQKAAEARAKAAAAAKQVEQKPSPAESPPAQPSRE